MSRAKRAQRRTARSAPSVAPLDVWWSRVSPAGVPKLSELDPLILAQGVYAWFRARLAESLEALNPPGREVVTLHGEVHGDDSQIGGDVMSLASLAVTGRGSTEEWTLALGRIRRLETRLGHIPVRSPLWTVMQAATARLALRAGLGATAEGLAALVGTSPGAIRALERAGTLPQRLPHDRRYPHDACVEFLKRRSVPGLPRPPRK